MVAPAASAASAGMRSPARAPPPTTSSWSCTGCSQRLTTVAWSPASVTASGPASHGPATCVSSTRREVSADPGGEREVDRALEPCALDQGGEGERVDQPRRHGDLERVPHLVHDGLVDAGGQRPAVGRRGLHAGVRGQVEGRIVAVRRVRRERRAQIAQRGRRDVGLQRRRRGSSGRAPAGRRCRRGGAPAGRPGRAALRARSG